MRSVTLKITLANTKIPFVNELNATIPTPFPPKTSMRASFTFLFQLPTFFVETVVAFKDHVIEFSPVYAIA